MARQWRIEYAGVLYHVLSRGNGGQEISRSKDDRHLFLDLLEHLVERFNIEVHAYVLICLLWKSRGLSNQEIGSLLGVTYSTVSKVVSAFSGRVQAEREVWVKFEKLNSPFKV